MRGQAEGQCTYACNRHTHACMHTQTCTQTHTHMHTHTHTHAHMHAHTHLGHERQVEVKPLDARKPGPNGKAVHLLHPAPCLRQESGRSPRERTRPSAEVVCMLAVASVAAPRSPFPCMLLASKTHACARQRDVHKHRTHTQAHTPMCAHITYMPLCVPTHPRAADVGTQLMPPLLH